MKAFPFSLALVALALTPSAAFAGGYTIEALTFGGDYFTPGTIHGGHLVGNAQSADGRVPLLWTTKGPEVLQNNLGFGMVTAVGANRVGIVAGSGSSGRTTQAIVWKGSEAELLPTEDGDDDDTESLAASLAFAVNDFGTVVGQGETQYGTVGVVWDGDDLRLLMSLNPLDEYQVSSAFAINNSGQIAGWADLDGSEQAVVWEKGGVRQIGGLGFRSGARDINDLGLSVGWSQSGAEAFDAFVNDGTTTTILPTLAGMQYTEAVAVNSAGVVVGNAAPGGISEATAVLWRDGKAYDLTSLLGSSDWQLYSATGIDDDGTIVGFGSYKGQYAAFRMTLQAVPEPASMLVLGLGTLALLRRRSH